MIENNKYIKSGFNFDNSYSKLNEIFFTKQNPSKVPSPKLVKLNYSLIKSLGLNPTFFESTEGIEVLAGNNMPEGASPIAEAYGGHQFGHFTMLGDGRAVLIGEHLTLNKERFDIQLKGSGRTPYSRGGDGKAALGPMLREYIISEAMNSLGIPTTRSLAVVTTGEKIMREEYLKGAVLTRVASSHIRVGTFQYISQWGSYEDLKMLADYTLKRHFLEEVSEENPYILLLKKVVEKQAKLIAKWQLVGFIHGVMNTDNMAISGETIDYGPCAFMDTYNPETVFSSIDINGRYAYGNQPNIAAWNLERYAETLLPLLHDDLNEAVKLAQNEVSKFRDLYNKNWIDGMRSKLGILNEEIQDESLIKELLFIMEKYKLDFTNTFRALTFDEIDKAKVFNNTEFKNWYDTWKKRLTRQQETKEQSIKIMQNSNPLIIPRNHRVEEAIDSATKKDDYSVMENLLTDLSTPYHYCRKRDYYDDLPKSLDNSYRTFCGT